jgi:hypothetical protein
MVDGDIRMNNYYDWDHTLSDGCFDEPSAPYRSFDMSAVVTHEWGHIAGLADLTDSSHTNLTMSGFGDCDTSQRTLGLGDHRGMISIYGAR